MKVIVAGAVAWTNADSIRRELAKLPPGTTVIYGDAPGADALAGHVARELGLTVEPMVKNKADYAKYQRGAWKGLNERMLARGVTRVLVFHPAIEQSRGSGHLIEIAKEAGVEVQVFKL